jgi:hypothetical protein
MDNKEFKEALAGKMQDKSQREALAQILVEYIQPNHITTDYVSMLLNTRSLNIGDALVKKIRKGIRVHTFVPGAIPLKNEITVSERINYALDGAVVGVQASEWDLQSGDVGTVESIRTEAQAKLRDFYMNKVFTALTTVWTAANTADNYTALGGHVTATALENALDRINNTTSGAKAIVGVRALLTPITKFGAFWNDGAVSATTEGIPSQLEEVARSGFLGKFMGVPIVALNQVYNNPEDYSALLPTDKILVIGENVGEFITYGPVVAKEWTDMEPTPPVWNFDMYQRFAFMVDNAMGLYVMGTAS